MAPIMKLQAASSTHGTFGTTGRFGKTGGAPGLVGPTINGGIAGWATVGAVVAVDPATEAIIATVSMSHTGSTVPFGSGGSSDESSLYMSSGRVMGFGPLPSSDSSSVEDAHGAEASTTSGLSIGSRGYSGFSISLGGPSHPTGVGSFTPGGPLLRFQSHEGWSGSSGLSPGLVSPESLDKIPKRLVN